ncbi:sarcosine oxidase [Daldinia grandis]|nr:sarcosine oxidase [Daldinia grandis]
MATLIVGAGCFGASTARFLKEADPDTDVILLDQAPFPDPAAAAHDLNKIVRAEYDDLMYMKLALEAKEAWSQADPVVTPFFHQTGALWSITVARTQTLVDNYETLLGPGKAPLETLSLDETRARFPLLGSCRFEGGAEQCILSPEAGWADAAGALQAVIKAAVNSGVRYEVGTAMKLELDPDGTCTGVSTTDGRTFPARHLHAGDRMKAAAVLMCLFKVPPGNTGLDMFKDAPVIVHPYGHFPAECIPPGSFGGPDLAKCTHEFPYTRNAHHEASKQEISVPPLSKSDRMTWTRDLPDALEANSARVRDMFFGNSVLGMTPESYRLCWDIATPDEDWIISPHPASKNLYIAAGGSFHGYKFLPIIGKYVAQMLHGELSEEHARRWAWDRDFIPIVTPYTPRGDLRDIPGYYE